MTIADPFADVTASAVPRGPGFARRHLWWFVGAVCAAAVAIAATWFLRWLYGPTALSSGDGENLGAPVKVGETFYSFPMLVSASSRPVTVDLRSITPRVSHDTADVSVQALVCKRNAKILVFGGPTARRDSYSWCRPFHPGTVTIGADEDYGQVTVILAVTARRPGAAEIDGLQVTYHQGIRRGSVDVNAQLQLWTGRHDPFTP